MEKQANFLLQIVLLLVALNSAQAEVVSLPPLKVGDDLVRDAPNPGPFTNILWKHNGNLVAEWTKGTTIVDYYGSFKGRTTLNTNTGQLTVKDMKVGDSGQYTVELNNIVQDQIYVVKVIQVLSKPTIWVQPVSCSPDMDTCTLICDGATGDNQPVTYNWKKDDGEWQEPKKNLTITKAGDAEVKTFTCRMKNPVGEEESGRLDNPFIPEPDIVPIAVGVTVPLLAILVAAGLAIWKKEAIMKRLRGEGYDRASTGAELNSKTETPSAPATEQQPPTESLADLENGKAET